MFPESVFRCCQTHYRNNIAALQPGRVYQANPAGRAVLAEDRRVLKALVNDVLDE